MMSQPGGRNSPSIGRFQAIVAADRSFGIKVIVPVAPDKIPVEKWRHFQTREPTIDEYEGWFVHFADYNAFVLTGEINGIFAIDCDGASAIEYFNQRGHSETWTSKSREGHEHFYFQWPGWR